MKFYQASKKDEAVVIDMDSIVERDVDGNPVGVGGKGKHSFRSFATQQFEVSDMVEADYNGIPAYQTTFKANINGGDFKVDIYMMLGDGTIQNGDEEIAVNKGQFKFTVSVDNWAWCEGTTPTDTNAPEYCGKGNKGEVGHHLDFTLAIKSKNAKPTAKGGSGKLGKRPPKNANGKHQPAEIDMGGGASMSLSSKVQVDGTWQDMPGADDEDSYPQVDTKGSKVLYTFRFPKAAKIFYDPGVDMGLTQDAFAAAFAQEEAQITAAEQEAAGPVVDDGAKDNTNTEQGSATGSTTAAPGTDKPTEKPAASSGVRIMAALAPLTVLLSKLW